MTTLRAAPDVEERMWKERGASDTWRVSEDAESAESEFDAEVFLAELSRLSLEGERIAMSRPSGEDISASLRGFTGPLYNGIDALRRIACLEADQDPTQTYSWFPRRDSTGERDMESNEALVQRYLASATPIDHQWLDTNPDRNPTAWGLDFVARTFYASVDHLEAVATLVATGDQARAPVTLARSVLEAASTGCYIIDPAVDASERLRRILNLQFAEVKELSNGSVAESDDRNENENLLQELIAFASLNGQTVQPYKPGRHLPPLIRSTTGHDSAGRIIDEVLPSGLGREVWRSMSAVAHSRRSVTLYMHEYGVPHERRPIQRVQSTAWHTLPALYAVNELRTRLAGYLGWDLGDWDEHFEVLVRHWAAAAGLLDDQIRHSLGLDG